MEKGQKVVINYNGELLAVEVVHVHAFVAGVLVTVKEPDGHELGVPYQHVVTKVANRDTMEALEELLPKPAKTFDHMVETADHLGAKADITQLITEHTEGAGN